jgi:LPXTG-motif cell wall-anchored protein
MKKFLIIFFLFFAALTFQADAQCAMCKRVAESSQDANDSKTGRGLNSGILYLLSIPYVLAGIGAYAYFKRKKS